MTVLEDFIASVAIQVLAFGCACFLSWRAGRPITAQGEKALKLIPYGFVGLAACSSIAVLGSSESQAVGNTGSQIQGAMGAVLWLIAALLSMLFSRVAPRIFDAGANARSAGTRGLTTAQIDAERRLRRDSAQVAFHFLAVGLASWAIAVYFAFQNANGELFAFGFIGLALWCFAVMAFREIWVRAVMSIRKCLGQFRN